LTITSNSVPSLEGSGRGMVNVRDAELLAGVAVAALDRFAPLSDPWAWAKGRRSRRTAMRMLGLLDDHAPRHLNMLREFATFDPAGAFEYLINAFTPINLIGQDLADLISAPMRLTTAGGVDAQNVALPSRTPDLRARIVIRCDAGEFTPFTERNFLALLTAIHSQSVDPDFVRVSIQDNSPQLRFRTIAEDFTRRQSPETHVIRTLAEPLGSASLEPDENLCVRSSPFWWCIDFLVIPRLVRR
jgi:hypothetical protein